VHVTGGRRRWRAWFWAGRAFREAAAGFCSCTSSTVSPPHPRSPPTPPPDTRRAAAGRRRVAPAAGARGERREGALGARRAPKVGSDALRSRCARRRSLPGDDRGGKSRGDHRSARLGRPPRRPDPRPVRARRRHALAPPGNGCAARNPHRRSHNTRVVALARGAVWRRACRPLAAAARARPRGGGAARAPGARARSPRLHRSAPCVQCAIWGQHGPCAEAARLRGGAARAQPRALCRNTARARAAARRPPARRQTMPTRLQDAPHSVCAQPKGLGQASARPGGALCPRGRPPALGAGTLWRRLETAAPRETHTVSLITFAPPPSGKARSRGALTGLWRQLPARGATAALPPAPRARSPAAHARTTQSPNCNASAENRARRAKRRQVLRGVARRACRRAASEAARKPLPDPQPPPRAI